MFAAGVELFRKSSFTLFPRICIERWFDMDEMMRLRMVGTNIQLAFIAALWTTADKRVGSHDVAAPFVILRDQAFQVIHADANSR